MFVSTRGDVSASNVTVYEKLNVEGDMTVVGEFEADHLKIDNIALHNADGGTLTMENKGGNEVLISIEVREDAGEDWLYILLDDVPYMRFQTTDGIHFDKKAIFSGEMLIDSDVDVLSTGAIWVKSGGEIIWESGSLLHAAGSTVFESGFTLNTGGRPRIDSTYGNSVNISVLEGDRNLDINEDSVETDTTGGFVSDTGGFHSTGEGFEGKQVALSGATPNITFDLDTSVSSDSGKIIWKNAGSTNAGEYVMTVSAVGDAYLTLYARNDVEDEGGELRPIFRVTSGEVAHSAGSSFAFDDGCFVEFNYDVYYNNLPSDSGVNLVLSGFNKISKESSTRETKKNIRPAIIDKFRILDLAPNFFEYKGSDKPQIGFLAEDAVNIPFLTVHNEEGVVQGFNNPAMFTYLHQVVVAQNRFINMLVTELNPESKARKLWENVNIQLVQQVSKRMRRQFLHYFVGFSRWIRNTARKIWHRGRSVVRRMYHVARKVIHRVTPIVSSIAGGFGSKGKAVSAAFKAADSAMTSMGDRGQRAKMLAHAQALASKKAAPYLQKGHALLKKVAGSRAGKIAASLAKTKEGGGILSKAIAAHPETAHAFDVIKNHINGASHSESTDKHVQAQTSVRLLNVFEHNPTGKTNALVKKHIDAHNPVTMSFGRSGAGQQHPPTQPGGISKQMLVSRPPKTTSSAFLGKRIYFQF